MKLSTYLPLILGLFFIIGLENTYADGRKVNHRRTTPGRGVAPKAPVKKQAPDSRRAPTGQCGTMNKKACDAFHEVNALRLRQGLEPLDGLSRCTTAAQAHAENMARLNFFSHDAPNESWSERMRRFQLSQNAVGENIAKTESGPERAVRLWIDSPGHFRNMVSQKFESAGMGHSQGYYVHCFSGKHGYELQ